MEAKQFIPLLSKISYQSVWFPKITLSSSYDDVVTPATDLPQIAKSPQKITCTV